MRAARLEAPGLGSLRVVDIDRPEPADGEVLIRVETVAVNQLELNVIDGNGPGGAAQLPRTLGLDAAGEIVALGNGVDASRLGQRVVTKPNIPCGHCAWCAQGREGDCPNQKVLGAHRDGGAAEYVVAPASNAFDIGDLDAAIASAAVHSVPIVLHAIEAAGGITASDTVLVLGSGGTLGQAAVHLLVDLGATVIAVSRRDRDLPAGVTALRTSELANAPEARVAIDVTGHGPTIAAGLKALAWNGIAVTCSSSLEPLVPLDGRDLVLKRKTLVGVGSANYSDVANGIALVRRGVAVPTIAARYPLESAADAYRAFSDPDREGKVIIDVR